MQLSYSKKVLVRSIVHTIVPILVPMAQGDPERVATLLVTLGKGAVTFLVGMAIESADIIPDFIEPIFASGFGCAARETVNLLSKSAFNLREISLRGVVGVSNGVLYCLGNLNPWPSLFAKAGIITLIEGIIEPLLAKPLIERSSFPGVFKSFKGGVCTAVITLIVEFVIEKISPSPPAAHDFSNLDSTGANRTSECPKWEIQGTNSDALLVKTISGEITENNTLYDQCT